jgi:cell division transport system permease protein
MLFRKSDVPLHRDATGRFLPWLIAVMVYLAALALVSAMAMSKIVTRWDRGLSGQITVQLPVSDSNLTAAAIETRRESVIRLLLQSPGVLSANHLGQEETAALLEPWLGQSSGLTELPLPDLIAVEIDQGAPPDTAALTARIEEIVPGAAIDDHQRWLGNLLSLARSIEIVAALVVFLVGLSAVIMVVFVTRMELAVHYQIVELLHLIGAQDGYIAGEFQTHALKLGFFGGLVGIAFAVLTIMGVSRLLGNAGTALLPELSLLPGEWAVLGILPLASAMVAMLTARFTVLRTLTRIP